MPEVIRHFTQRWPGVEVILRDDFLGRSLDRLVSGEVDFAVTPNQKADPRFDFEPLYSDELLLIAPAGHPLLRGSSVSLAAVSKYPLLSLPVQTAMWGIILDAFAAEGIEFKPTFQTMHVLSLIAMVKAGFGLAFLPSMLIPLLNMEPFGMARIGVLLQ